MQYIDMRIFIIVLVLMGVDALFIKQRMKFLRDFVEHQRRPGAFVAWTQDANNFKYNELAKYRPLCVMKKSPSEEKHDIYISDLNNNMENLLIQADTLKSLKTPNRWMFFYNPNECQNNDTVLVSEKDNNVFDEVNKIMSNISIGVDTEVYFAFEYGAEIHVYLAYKISVQYKLIWELYGRWSDGGFDRPPPSEALATRRHDLLGHPVTSVIMITNNSTYDHLINYLHREIDTTTKLTYYFAVHLFEWMNATAVYKPVNSYGYLKPDGTYDGIIGELMAGTSHFSVVMFFMTKERMNAVEYVVSPSRVSVIMLFRKPSLASVTNIYSLPFHIGVWLAVMSLTFVSSVALTGSTYWEDTFKNRPRNSLMKQFTQSVYETLGGIVFQQGTSVEPQSVSSRQVVLLSLMAFMFLHTAYSANVVALLQSATDISGPEGILNSPMEYGATDIIYNHHIFKNEHRPVHRALWLKKGLPQGDKFFSTVEEGIRRVREGMYAFHVEQTAGFDEVQRTFLEHEKCNLGYFSYVSFPMPHLGVSKVSQYKELLRIGAFLLKERGVQARSSNRLVAPPPKCAAGTAFFTAVGIQDVAPAFLLLITIYSLVILMFALEVVLHRYELKKEQNKEVRTILASRNTQATIATP